MSYVATPTIREAFLGFPSLKSNRGANFLRRNYHSFLHRIILAKGSRDVRLLKPASKQEAEIVHEFKKLRDTFFDPHYGHDNPPECFPLIVIGTIFDTAWNVNASLEILNQ
jgi:hypothetical protein